MLSLDIKKNVRYQETLMSKQIDKYLIRENFTIKKSLSVINKTSYNTVFIIDSKDILKGSLTDGDIRRALLGNANKNTKINNIYNKNPKYLIREKYLYKDVKNLFIREKINIIPVLNKDKKIYKFITWEEFLTNKKKQRKINFLSKIPIIIMAGGKGTRLKPYTNILPKPLMPINNKAIIEHIIDRFIMYGAKNFHISINKNNHIIKAFFRERNYQEKIIFLEEKKSLGTCGSLSLVKPAFAQNNFILVNCDVISDIDFKRLLTYHSKRSSIMTVVAANKNHVLSYGSIDVDNNGFLKTINEKPSLNLLVNVGIYVLNKKCLKYIPKNKVFDINHLIELLKSKDQTVSVFEIDDESWIDTGQINKFNKAKNILEKN